jgi:hypothetical protein
MVDCINVLIWGGVKLTKFLKYTYKAIAAVIVSAAVTVYTHFQSRRATFWKNLMSGGGALLAMRNLRQCGGVATPLSASGLRNVIPALAGMNRVILMLSTWMILCGCGGSVGEVERLSSENLRLKEEIALLNGELERYKTGSEKILPLIEQYYEANDLLRARENIKILTKYHPEDLQKPEVQRIISLVTLKEQQEKDRQAALERERIRLENLNNTGIWRIARYVDGFGEPMDKRFITTAYIISGKFNKPYTENANLNVKLLISSSYDISIMLYESPELDENLGREPNPVKAYSNSYPLTYTALVQDREGNRYQLSGTNTSDRISFKSNASTTIHNALMKGGSVKFNISEDNTPNTIYRFEITNADWYENAYRLLTGN